MSSKEFEEVMEMLHHYMERVGTLEAQMEEQQERTKTLKTQQQKFELRMNIKQCKQEMRIQALEKQLQELQQEQQRRALPPLHPTPNSSQPQPPPPPPPATAPARIQVPERGRGRGRGRGGGRGGRGGSSLRPYRIEGMEFWAENLRYVGPDGVNIEF